MPPPDPLADLREKVRATQQAAERLAAEGREAGAWSRRQTEDELDALVALLRSLRELVPPELQQQVTEVMRDVLLVLRALIDYWVARLEPAPRATPEPAQTQDTRRGAASTPSWSPAATSAARRSTASHTST